MKLGELVTIAIGQSRPVARAYPDGTYECPWCHNPVFSQEGWGEAPERGDYPRYEREAYDANLCPNPACPANPLATAEGAQAILARWQAAADERAAQERRAASFRQAADEAEQRRVDRWREVRREAEERGACMTCLRKSPWEFGTPRYVRHRGECPVQRDLEWRQQMEAQGRHFRRAR